jgi:hypothetical protein
MSNVEEALDDLFSDAKGTESIQVELPSKGLAYKTGGTGPVKVRPLNYEDERAIAAAKSDENIISIILDRCVEGVNADDLLFSDRLFLTYMVRSVSFGDEIKLEATCRACAAPNSLQINISDLPVSKADEDFTGILEVDLEDLGKRARVRLPRVGDEEWFTSTNKTLDNLWRFVIELGGYNQANIVSEAIKKMTSRDIKQILKAVSNDEIGIESRAKYLCSSCKKENQVYIPINTDFFLAS